MEERCQVADDALRALCSSDWRAFHRGFAMTIGPAVTTCSALISMFIFSEANWQSICTSGGSPFALSVVPKLANPSASSSARKRWLRRTAT